MNGRKHKWNSRRRQRAIFGFRQSKLCLNQKTDSREFIKARRSSRFGRWNCKLGRSGEEILRWQSQALTDSARARVKAEIDRSRVARPIREVRDGHITGVARYFSLSAG